jgi:hypothetical protein
MAEVKGSQEQAVVNSNPREELAGWSVHPKAAKVLLIIQIAWLAAILVLPKDWATVRMACFTVGMFCSGLLAAKKIAMWQRTGR